VDRLDEAEQRLAGLQSRLDSITAEIDREESALAARQEELAAAQSQAALATEQARRAEASASGNLAGATVFRIDGVSFEPGTSRLTEASRLLLDQLVERLRAENAAYFLEVQSDPGEANSPLGHARVDAVRRYLHLDHGLPLHSVGAVTGTSVAALASGDGQLAILVVRDLPQP
jgi:outer membrane protein OmpA-like peptidoglycan-associated protein